MGRGDDVSKLINDKVNTLTSGEELRQFQQMLIDKGYDLPKYGADGKIGNETRAAARKYYRDIANTVTEAATQEELQQQIQAQSEPRLAALPTAERVASTIAQATPQVAAGVIMPESDAEVPSFAEYMYTTGRLGTARRLGNLASVAWNYANSMLNPSGDNASLSEGARRQMVGAAYARHESTGKYGITDTEHQNLGGMTGHSGQEFRADTGMKGFIQQAMDAPYHNIFGQSGHVSNDGLNFDPGLDAENPDAYTYNNVWRGNKVVEVKDDGTGQGSLRDALDEYRAARASGSGLKQALESAASIRGVDVSAGKSSRVSECRMRKYFDEYNRTISDQKRLKKYNKRRKKLSEGD